MTRVDARGEICPIPLIKAKEAIKNLNGAGNVEVLVDNEIASPEPGEDGRTDGLRRGVFQRGGENLEGGFFM